MSTLKAIKTGHEKLQERVLFLEQQIKFYASDSNIKAQRKAIEDLALFEKQNEINLKAIKNYPFLAK